MKEKVKKCIKPIYNIGKKIIYGAEGFFNEKGLCFNGNSKKLYRYKNLHKGKRCFLIGTGPSLRAEDLELIKGEYSMSCNMIYKIYEQTAWRPNYHCVTERLYAKHECEELVRNVKVPFFTPYSTWKRMRKHPADTTYVRDIYDEHTYEVRGKFMSYCWLKATVMVFMLELAIYMGFQEIYLLGVDCTNIHQGKGHFIKDYTKKEVMQQDEERMKKAMKKNRVTKEDLGAYNYRRSIEAYTEIDNFAKQSGIKIYNATRGGNLEVFDRVALESVV